MMGLEIVAKPGPIPRELMLKLTCDGDHGLLPARVDIFQDAPFPDLFTAALDSGWLETFGTQINQTPDGPKVGVARLFLCPECSGK